MKKIALMTLTILAFCSSTVLAFYLGFSPNFSWGSKQACQQVEKKGVMQVTPVYQLMSSAIGSTQRATFALSNVGNASITGIVFDPYSTVAFTHASSATNPCGTTLAAKASCNKDVLYTGTSGTQTGTLVIESDQYPPTGHAALSGKGITAENYSDIVSYWSMTTTTVDKSQSAITVGLSNSTVSGGVLTTTNASGAGASLTGASIPFPGTTGRIGFYFTPSSWSTNIIWIWEPDANNKIYAQGSGSSELVMTYQAGAGTIKTVTTSGAGLAATVQHFLEFAWDNTGAGSYKIFVDGVQRGSTTTGLSGTMAGTGNLNLGRIGGNNMPGVFDQMIISNTATRDIYSIRSRVSFP